MFLQHIRRYASHIYGEEMFKHVAKKCLYRDETFDVNSAPTIHIFSELFVKVVSYDMLVLPSMNRLHAQLFGTNCTKPTASITVKIEGKAKDKVEIVCKKLDKKSDWHLELYVPLKSNLNISASGSASIRNIVSPEIRVTAHSNIHTYNVNTDLLELLSCEGDIECEGIFMSYKAVVQTGACGNIYIKKIQGKDVGCKTEQGNILVSSSYGIKTSFSTQTGKIDLRNFHKEVQVCIHKSGFLVMAAFNGNINATVNGGRLILDLIQVKGSNVINANEVENALVCLSETMEKNVNTKITGSSIELKPELEHLCEGLNEEKTVFNNSTVKNKQTEFILNAESADISLKRISWFRSMQLAYRLHLK